MKQSERGLDKGDERTPNNAVKQSESGLEKGDKIIPNNAVKQSERGLEKGGEIPENGLRRQQNPAQNVQTSKKSHMIHQVINKRNQTCFVCLEKLQNGKHSGKSG